MAAQDALAALTGLTEADARARLASDGFNELPTASRRGVIVFILDVLREPMLLLLLVAGGIYLVLGELSDALVLLVFAGLSIVITIVQGRRTERAIDVLRDSAAPLALVIRGNARRRIPARELVCGDLLVIAEGDRIAADGWIVTTGGLQTDEATLTGESIAVVKRARTQDDSLEPPLPGGDGLPYVFSGSLVVRGHAIILVDAIGMRTRIGVIGQSLAALDTQSPRLTSQTRRLVGWFALIGLGVSVLATILFGVLRGSWIDALLAGIALAMSMLPEELPVVLTVFMTMGALRMARVRVLARRGSAIESLGAATVLCTDKTGTLTQNRMEIAELRLPGGNVFAPGSQASFDLPPAFADLAGLGLLACDEQPFDPMEKAFHELSAQNRGENMKWRQHCGWTMRRQYGLSADLLAVTHVWAMAGKPFLVAAKGAPEAIGQLCGMTEQSYAAMERCVGQMAASGMRVLGIAEARWPGLTLPSSQQQFAFRFRGLAGLADPIRPSVPDAVQRLQTAGIRVAMITGDYPVTARAIAAQAGIGEGEVMTGQQLAALDDAGLAESVQKIAVFARIMPEQKLRIVKALKAAGEIVAMTGDGVNDAPSLKAAHIGVAMGQRGTDVAREAASVVLMDDDFGAIPDAIRLGRRIYDNVRKAMIFIFAVHIPIGGLALAPLLAGWPIILGPAHIALIEMVIDPVCAVAFEAEPEENDIMRRKPRDPAAPLFPRRLLLWSALQGTVTIALLVGLVIWTHGQSAMTEPQMRSIAFTGLVAAVLVLVATDLTYGGAAASSAMWRNLPLLVITALVALVFIVLFCAPGFARLFRFAPFGWQGSAAIITMVLILAIVLASLKLRYRKAMSL
ncbi:cation-translocating P-type ATPase [Novosphingobium sp.]|uniref:cation-translocating P-type ATPase n=1 Tax=Novosphingobium sp. TaxID=1874826 RepID=UPI0025D32618|nr:cation-translocating P-type ATPase [Novosphingobium sp.]